MNVTCIKCGKAGDETVIGVVVTTGEIHSGDCDEVYSVDEVESHIAAWARLVPWIKSHPARQVPKCSAAA